MKDGITMPKFHKAQHYLVQNFHFYDEEYRFLLEAGYSDLTRRNTNLEPGTHCTVLTTDCYKQTFLKLNYWIVWDCENKKKVEV